MNAVKENSMGTELISFIEKRAENAENLRFCNGIKLNHIKDCVAQMLNTIGYNNIFSQYTRHDISHVNEMLRIAEWLIPEDTKQSMTSSDFLMLTLAIYFHDLGMVVSQNEFNNRNTNSEFLRFKSAKINSATKEYKEFYEDESYLYQEFVRQFHAERIRGWLDLNSPNKYGLSDEQQSIINSMFSSAQDFDLFKNDLGMICESHHLDDLNDFSKYRIQSRYGNSDDEIVNLNYVAIILRIADLLHITNDRTPSIPRILIDVDNPISILEWEKQKAVKAIAAQKKRNNEGCIDDTIPKDTIEVTAHFSGSETAEAYFGLSSYLNYVKSELISCNKIAEQAKKMEGSKCSFPWTEIDETHIRTEGFEAKKLSFTIEQENILKLLVGHTLYNDSSVVVRELAQNAIDSIKLQRIIDIRNNKPSNNGKVSVRWDENDRTLSFYDNGTGMTIYDIENYLLRVGSSKYRQQDFIEKYTEFTPISRFGIGILTCFMVANDVDIITNHVESEKLNIICLRNVNGKYLLRKEAKEGADEYIKEHGTIIKLHVRSDIDMSNLENILKKWIVVTEVPVELITEEKTVSIGYASLKDALICSLKESNIIVDEKKYMVETKTSGNVTVACVLQYNNYFSDWSFITADRIISRKKTPIIGTCVEGIRVEFNSPGYNNKNLLALANISGSRYQTNVARTALEYDSNQEVLKSIYDCYRMFIEDQIALLKKTNYSSSWAVKEGTYLLTPLLPHNHSISEDNIMPINAKVLIQSLSELKCLFVEQKKHRDQVSVTTVQNYSKFDLFECKLISAIEFLFREIPVKTTVFEMIESVLSNPTFISNNPVITNYDSSNILHQQIVKNKQVTQIQVDTITRKIQLTFENGSDLWDTFPSMRHSIFGYHRIHIPKKQFKICGLKNEIGVNTISGIYLNSDSPLCNYLIESINALRKTQLSYDTEAIIQLFLESIFNSNILEPAFTEKDFNIIMHKKMRNSNILNLDSDVSTEIWKVLNVEKFKEIVLSQKHSIFSLSNWTRSTM